MAHTPGPWVIELADYDSSYIRATYRRSVICETYAMAGDEAFEPGNAHLIAAAPELLSALRDLLDAIGGEDSTDIWCVSARAAIAKAEGRAS